MKIDCPECGGGVGVLSIREGRAKCPSCGREFEAEGRLPRASSRRGSVGEAGAGGQPTSEESTQQQPALRSIGEGEPSPLEDTRLEPIQEVAPPEVTPPEVTPPEVTPPEVARHHTPPPASHRSGGGPATQGGASSRSSGLADVTDELGRVGPYEDIRQVARGGMGVVYKARDRQLKRTVAIKVLKRDIDDLTVDPEEVRRFRREAEAAARLQHSNIVPIHAVGEVLGRPYFVMDFIEGRVLSELVRSGELSPRSALDIVEQVAEAIQYAHSQGVIHRDLKPQNIIIDRLGRPQVMDFGLAKQLDEDQTLTRTGTTMGTPAYMPPEQAEGDVDSIDARSDVYAIGAVLYEMLTGTPPFTGTSTMNVLMKVLEEEPAPPRAVNPRIHRDIETICLKAMSKEKSRRYASARELAEDIRRFRAGEAISAAPSTFLYGMKRWAAKNRAAVALVVALVVAFGALSGWVLGGAERERNRQVALGRRRLRQLLDRAEGTISEAERVRDQRLSGWRDRAREKLDAAVSDAEYVLRTRPGDEKAEDALRRARKMRRALRADELLEHAKYFLEKDQHLAAETFYRLVLQDYDSENEDAKRGLMLASGVGRLLVRTDPAGVKATLLPASERNKEGSAGLLPSGTRKALGNTPIERSNVPTGLYRLVLFSERVGRHEVPVEITRSREVDLGEIHLPEEGGSGDGMVYVPDGLVELPGGARTWIDAFLIDRYESGARLGQVPRDGMSWVEATAACRERGKRPCRLSEWRRACSGAENVAFPYGRAFDQERCWTGRTRGPSPAGGRAGCVSPFGVYDMSGNVAEWVGLTDARATTYGGDWSARRGALAGCGSDFYRSPHERAPRAGFRCCRDASGAGK